MATRKEIVNRMISAGMGTSKALSIAQIPRSTYYYQSNGLRKGRLPSTKTLYKGQWVSNDRVVSAIHEMLAEDFIDYGYIRTAQSLKIQGFIINKKKVYRIMKEQQLLYPYKPLLARKKAYVAYSSPIYARPFEALEMDFKYIYIQGVKKHAYLVSIQDIFTRMCLVWDLNWDMKTIRVVERLNQLCDRWFIPYEVDPKQMSVIIRTDNGSQFIAKLFIDWLNHAHIQNEYIHPGTPQQNGHIESLHGTIQRLVCTSYTFESLDQAREVFTRFYDTYNNKRIMRAILYHTPAQFLALWYQNKIDVQSIDKKITYRLSHETKIDLSQAKSIGKRVLQIENEYNKILT